MGGARGGDALIDRGPMPWLRVALVAHGGVTLAAAVVLCVRPAAIPATVGVAVDARGALLSWFLGAAELAIGLLSLGAARLDDVRAVRLVVAVFAAFHLSTALLELVWMADNGTSGVLWANVAVRLVVAAVFLELGRRL